MSDTMIERIAKAFHEGLAAAITECAPASEAIRPVRWEELDDEQRAWMLDSARRVIETLGLTEERRVVLGERLRARIATRYVTGWERTDG